jgi:hypothetical protein
LSLVAEQGVEKPVLVEEATCVPASATGSLNQPRFILQPPTTERGLQKVNGADSCHPAAIDRIASSLCSGSNEGMIEGNTSRKIFVSP